MKKLFLLALFGFMTFLGTAQVTVTNSTSETLMVGAQYTSSGCTPEDSENVSISPGNSHTFNPPSGMIVLIVGASGVSGSDFEYSPCSGCSGSPATVYTFNWSAPTTYCAYLTITP